MNEEQTGLLFPDDEQVKPAKKFPYGRTQPDAYARRSDPATSHAAAAQVKAQLERLCVATLQKFPEGLTTLEIAELTNVQRVSISPRMKPLADKGLIRDSGKKRAINGRASIVWVAIAQEAVRL